MKRVLPCFLTAVFFALFLCGGAFAYTEWTACVDDNGRITIADLAEGLPLFKGTLTLGVGETYALSIPPDEPAVFTSTEPRYVSVTSDGILQAKKTGDVKIGIYLGEVCVELRVCVKKAPTSISLNASKKTLKLGETFSLSYTLSSNSGGSVKWASSNESIAYVDAQGVIYPQRTGTCEITCTAYNSEKIQAVCKLTVEQPAPAKVVLQEYMLTLARGEEGRLYAQLEGGYNETITFSSNNETVAEIYPNGSVFAKEIGTAILRVQASGGNYTNCVLNVVEPAKSISFTENPIRILRGGTSTLPVQLEGGSGRYSVLSMDPQIAEVEKDGISVTGKNVGSTDLYVVSPNGVYGICTVNVMDCPSDFSVTVEDWAILVKGTTTLHVKNAPMSCTFVSEDPSIAIVDENGTITGVKLGETRIACVCGGLKEYVNITVAKLATKLTLKLPVSQIGVGDKIQLICTTKDGAGHATFTSSNKNVLSVDKNTGVVTAHKYGSATITAKLSNGAKAKLEVTVKRAPQSIQLTEKNIVLALGDQFQMNYKLNEKAACIGEWSCADEAIVSLHENGLIKAKQIGETSIKVSTHNNLSDETSVIVMDAPSTLNLNTEKLTDESSFDAYVKIKKGKTHALLTDLQGFTYLSVSYLSSNEQVAKVSTTGVISAKSAGTARITVTLFTGLVIQILVEVEA